MCALPLRCSCVLNSRFSFSLAPFFRCFRPSCSFVFLSFLYYCFFDLLFAVTLSITTLLRWLKIVSCTAYRWPCFHYFSLSLTLFYSLLCLLFFNCLAFPGLSLYSCRCCCSPVTLSLLRPSRVFFALALLALLFVCLLNSLVAIRILLKRGSWSD